ncbi:MAG: hypothetical protein ABEJ78_09005 [Haloferacaceae archaeon]
MGLRCLLGHDFGNREVERERQEDGNEVVVTYRTVETCQRCGDRRVVSENKEVRPIRGGEEMQTGLGGGVDVTAGADGDASADESATADEPTADGATDADGATAADATAETADPADAIEAAEADADDGPSAAEDDGIILTDDGDDGDDTGRRRGQWPDADVNDRSTVEAGAATTESAPSTDDAVAEQRSANESTATDDGVERAAGEAVDAAADDAVLLGSDDRWPDHEGDDEGFDAEPGGSGGTDVSFGGGLTPEASEATNGAAAYVDGDDGRDASATDKEFVRADDADVDIDRSEPGTRSEFYCPNCGLSRLAGESSMRAGDICPDCRKGYIAERDA